jgi:GNAT superfamily N-acetyltransferase
VRLDYVIPSYRDLKIGRYLYSERTDFFRDRGIRQIVSPAGSAEHTRYQRRMGFTAQPGEPGVMRLRVEQG